MTKSGLPGSDWVINPYNGCLFGCLYCYAAQIARWKHPDEEWGTYLDVKINAPQLLKEELIHSGKKLHSKDFGSIFLSSVTDPYVGLEAKYKLTRGCLSTLADFNYEGEVVIQTKSPLVTRDIDILHKLKKVSVGFTVTSLDDEISRFLEVKAPPVTKRIETIRQLTKEEISTYAFIGPILPYFVDREKEIEKILDKLVEVGASEVWFEFLNLNGKIKERLYTFLRKCSPELLPYFELAETKDCRRKLDEVILKAVKKRGLKMGLGKVIYHKELPKKK